MLVNSEENMSMDNTGLEEMVREFFADTVKVLGLPKSVGEIYGALFISKTPLSLDDLVEQLEIVKVVEAKV